MYSYDDIYQITGRRLPRRASIYLATDTEFTYDDAGNRTSVIDGSGTCNYTSNNLNQYTAAGTTSFTYDDSGNMTADGHYTYTYDPENRLTQVEKPDPAPQQLNYPRRLHQRRRCPLGGGLRSGFAQSGSIGDDQESWMYIDVEGPGTVQFQWKVSSQPWSRLPGVLPRWRLPQLPHRASRIGGRRPLPSPAAGSHRLKWCYDKDSSDSEGDDCGYVKAVTFTPPPCRRRTVGPGGGLGAGLYDRRRRQLVASDGLALLLRRGLRLQRRHQRRRGVLDADDRHGGRHGQVLVEGLLGMERRLPGVLPRWTAPERSPSAAKWIGQQKTYTITGTGTAHAQWRYHKDGSDSEGDDCGWVD